MDGMLADNRETWFIRYAGKLSQGSQLYVSSAQGTVHNNPNIFEAADSCGRGLNLVGFKTNAASVSGFTGFVWTEGWFVQKKCVFENIWIRVEGA